MKDIMILINPKRGDENIEGKSNSNRISSG